MNSDQIIQCSVYNDNVKDSSPLGGIKCLHLEYWYQNSEVSTELYIF